MGMMATVAPWEWGAFFLLVLVLLALDLLVFNREAHEVSLKEAALWSVVWICVALGFNGFILYEHGDKAAVTFLTAYLVEKSLSVDNLFVFLAIFGTLGIGPRYQHRVLFWGILGALIMRMAFIGAGTALLARFDWMIYVFGAFLLYTGIKLGFSGGNEEENPKDGAFLTFAKKRLRVTQELHGSRFFVRRDRKLYVTPLFLALLLIELSDVLFAFDSVPAVLGISQDLFIVYTSNIMAILGLRALYFLLAKAVARMRFLHIGLSVVLAFIGLKMLASSYIHLNELLSLGIIATILLVTFAASAWLTKPESKS